jgi:hypothetical protein
MELLLVAVLLAVLMMSSMRNSRKLNNYPE